MSELTEIAVVILKHLSDALLSASYELSKSKKSDSIIASTFIENPKIETLKTGDHVLFSVKNRRYWGTITLINGDKVELQNRVLQRSWVIASNQILLLEPE